MRCLNCYKLFRPAFGDDLSARSTTFWAEVDDPVGGFDDIEIMFNDDQRVAGIHEFVEDGEQFLDVFEMQAGRRLIHNVEHVFGRSIFEFSRNLEPLGLAAGEGGRGLAKP